MIIAMIIESKPEKEGRLGGSVGKRPTLAQVMISQLMSSSPASGSVLTALSLEPALILCLLLSAPPQLALCLCLSQK